MVGDFRDKGGKWFGLQLTDLVSRLQPHQVFRGEVIVLVSDDYFLA